MMLVRLFSLDLFLQGLPLTRMYDVVFPTAVQISKQALASAIPSPRASVWGKDFKRREEGDSELTCFMFEKVPCLFA